MHTDLIIVGAGPAGIFTALELIRNGSKKKIVLIEKASRSKNGTAPRSPPSTVSIVSRIATSQPVFPVQARFLTENFP